MPSALNVTFLRAAALASALFAVLPAAPAVAQDNQINTLVQQIQRLRDDLTLLQRDYYQGRTATPPPAATLNTNANPQLGTQFVNQFETRLAGFEDELRSLVGTIERIERGVTDSRARLDKLVGDVDFRLNAIERQLTTQTTAVVPPPANTPAATPPAPAPTVAAVTPPRAATPAQPTPPAPQTPVEVAPGRPNPAAGAQVLGVLTPEQARTPLPAPTQTAPQAAVQPGPQVAPAQPGGTILPRGSAKEQYDFAYGLLQQFRIPDAERAFTEFLAAHANDELSHNARYWLGETYYARAQYQQAAVTFLDAYERANTGPKAPDNLLKLGMSLARLEQKPAACAALAELNTRFPQASADIRNQATAERRRVGC
jgi:tol-pal system protein YbgF